MIPCLNCQTENRQGAKFCDNCGARLEVTCPNCGTVNRVNAKFCDHCGQRLAGDGQKPAAKPSFPAPSPGSPLENLIPQEFAIKLETARAEKTMVGERRIVTILFCDVKGSTAAAGRLDPEEWAEIINGAFERMISPVYQYEGTVARLMGDGILAFFGAPIAHEDDPQRAVLAGLEILQEIRPYREQVRQRWGVDFDLRVGINTGLVMVGQVGSDLQMEYTALGDAINLAARMEQIAQPGMVQIAEDTYKLVAPLFEWEDLGEIEVKGKDRPVHAYRPLGLKVQPGRLRGLESHGISSPLVGREIELGLLQKRLEALKTNSGSTVLVIGEAGLGKSRLVAELHGLVGDLPQPGIIWLEGHTVSYRHSSSYYPWRQVIRQAIGAAETDPPAIARQKLGEACLRVGLPAADAPFLETLLAIESESTLEAVRGIEGQALVQRMTEATRKLISAIVRETPAVIVFDDLHWADDASLELLLSLADLPRLDPVFIIGLLRPDKAAPSWAFRQRLQDRLGSDYAEIALVPLTEQVSRDMLSHLLSFDELPESLRAVILRKAEGNPFYVEEVVRALIESGVLVQGTDPQTGRVTWQATASMEDIDIPENLQTLLIARIDRLEDEARRTLQLASVIGRSFYYRVLDAIHEAAAAVRPELDRQLLTLQRAELILEAARLPEPEYMFRHSLTQEAAYNTILLKQRREFHRQVGEAIETIFAGRMEEFYPVLAHHFGEAGDPRSLQYERLAGDAAFRLFAVPQATGHYSRALAIAKSVGDSSAAAICAAETGVDENHGLRQHLYLRLGRCYELQSLYSDALRIYEEMEGVSHESGDRKMELSALIAQATVYAIPTPVMDAGKARSFAGNALALARQMGDSPAEARLLWIYLLSFMYSGRMEEGIPFGEDAAALARQLGLREQLAHALQDLSLAYMSVGQLQKCRSALEEAGPIWEELGNLPMLAETRANSALERSMAGEFEASIARSEESYRISRQIKNEWGQVSSRVFVATVYYARGEIERAIGIADAVAPQAARIGHPGAALIRAQSAFCYESLNAMDRALEAAEEAVELTKSFTPFYSYALAVLGRFYLRAGDRAKAGELRRQSSEIRHKKILLKIDVEIELIEIEYDLTSGDLERAAHLLDSLLDLLTDSGARYFLPDGLRLKARLLLSQDRPEEALAALQEARSAAEEIDFHTARWVILAEAAEVEAQLGRAAEAERLRDQARDGAEVIAGQIGDPELLASFREKVQATCAPSEATTDG